MDGYLGEFPVTAADAPLLIAYGPAEWAMHIIEAYGGIDGEHHKAWVLDQVARILKGTPVILSQARWANGEREIRYQTGEPSAEYLRWVDEMTEDGEEYDVGIAP